MGCSTTLVGHNGTRFRTYANASTMDVTLDGARMAATGLNHSTPTRAGGSVAGTVAAGVAGVLTAGAVPGL